MALDLSNKALTMMLKTVIGSLGIDGEALLANLMQFQQFVMGQIQHHDKRLVAIELAVLEQNRLLTLILENQNVGRTKQLGTIEFTNSNRANPSPYGGTIESDA
jgi:hypothetical protein